MTQIKIRKTERERAESSLDAKGACLMSEPISIFLRFSLAPLIVCELYECSGVFANVFDERNWAHAGKKLRSKEKRRKLGCVLCKCPRKFALYWWWLANDATFWFFLTLALDFAILASVVKALPLRMGHVDGCARAQRWCCIVSWCRTGSLLSRRVSQLRCRESS